MDGILIEKMAKPLLESMQLKAGTNNQIQLLEAKCKNLSTSNLYRFRENIIKQLEILIEPF